MSFTSGLTGPERWLLWLIGVSCLAFALLTPPFQAPDEPQHLSRAVRLAHGAVFAERQGGAVGGAVPRGYADLSAVDFPREAFGVPTRYRLADLAAAATPRPGDDRPVFVEFANIANYAPTLYLPQALAVAAGEAAGLPALGCVYLARLFNALAFLALLWAAVRVMPFGRPVMLAVAALPTVAYQGASVSPDATINGLGWLAIALSLAVGHAAAGPARRGWLVAAAVPLGLCKGLYVPLVLAGARGRAIAWCGLALMAGAAAFVLWTLAAGGDQAVYVVESRVTGALVTTAPLSAQLHLVLADPLRYARVLASSMAERSPVYVLQLVGRFGWNAILLPLAAYPLAAVMLAMGVLAGLGRPQPVAVRGWWLALGLGIIVLVETALYLTGTPLGAAYVQGTQGRYFLPALPLLFLGVAPAARLAPGGIRPERWLLGTACALHAIALATAVDAFWVHGFTSHHGLPPFAPGVDGVLRTLLLPSPRW